MDIDIEEYFNDKLENIIQNHYKEIRDFFTKKNADFIEFDIENDTIEKLRKYISIPKDIKEFPHYNSTKR